MGPINENKGCLFMINNDGSYSEIGKIELTTTTSGKIKLPLWLKLFFLKLRIKNKFRKILMRHSPSKEWQNIYKEEN